MKIAAILARAALSALLLSGCAANPKPPVAIEPPPLDAPDQMSRIAHLSRLELGNIGDAARESLDAASKLPGWDQVHIPPACWKPAIAALRPIRVEQAQGDAVRIVLMSRGNTEEGIIARPMDVEAPLRPASEEIDTPLYQWDTESATTNPDDFVSLWTFRTVPPATAADWGWTRTGLQYRMLPPDRPLAINHTPTVDVQVRNVSDHPLQIGATGQFFIRVAGVSGENTWTGQMNQEDPTIQPDQSYVLTLDIGETFDKPGRYQVEVEYAALSTSNYFDDGPQGRQCPPMVLPVVEPGQTEPPAADPTTWADGPWGPVVAGMQVRLVAAESWLQSGASEAFLSADARNFGPLRRQFTLTPPWVAVEWDGVWYHPPARLHYQAKPTYPFGPGNRWQNLFDSLTDDEPNTDMLPQNGWESDNGKTLVLGPGKHTVRLAITVVPARGLSGKSLRLVSNPIEIPMLAPATRPAPPATAPALAAETDIDLTGRVIDDATGNPIEHFAIQSGSPDSKNPAKIDWGGEQWSNSGWPSGRFSIHEESTAKQSIWYRILSPGYRPQPIIDTPLTAPVSKEGLAIRLKRGIDLHGQVLDDAGRPVAGATVLLAGQQELRFDDGHAQDGYEGSRATTDAAGRFTLPIIGDGTDKVIVSCPMVSVWLATVADPTKELTIRLPAPATVRIRYDIDGADSPATFVVDLKTWKVPDWEGIMPEQTLACQNGGSATVANLAPGAYNISRLARLRMGDAGGDYWCNRQAIKLKPGETQTLDFRRPTGQRITGTLSGLENTGIPGALIFVRDQAASADPRDELGLNHPLYDALTCPIGQPFTTEHLSPGTYAVIGEAYGPDNGDLGWRLPQLIARATVVVPATGKVPPMRLVFKPLAEKPARSD